MNLCSLLHLQPVFSWNNHFLSITGDFTSYDYINNLPESGKNIYNSIHFDSWSVIIAVANHFILFFLGIETLSISLYVLIAFQDRKTAQLKQV